MLAKLRRHLTYANIVSTVCLFVLLGGSAYAATRIGSRQIVDNSIRSKDIGNNQVSSADVRNRSLQAKDFRPGQLSRGARGLPGPKGARGSRGSRGAKGATGSRGAQGPPGISGLQRVEAVSAFDSVTEKTATANCPVGKRVIGTGADIVGSAGDVVIDSIKPSSENSVPGSVVVLAYEDEATTADWSVAAYALCARVS